MLSPGPNVLSVVGTSMNAGRAAGVALATVAGTAILSVIGHVLYAVAFSTNRVVAVYTRTRRGIEVTLGLFFGLAGVKLLASRT